MVNNTDENCGYYGSIHQFLNISKNEFIQSLLAHHQRCMNMPAGDSQIFAWKA
ncbi:MAG: hypothetical protein JXA98_08785 [Methanosarcinaceae archaeon]|nr:hypothetical protein [Methanosarcinaceae archaeon]